MPEGDSSALACCARLESFTGAFAHDPRIWLGLSHLHTLRDVALEKVSTAAIAAALPKLHTLAAFGYLDDPAQTAGFFTDLLPRLRVFHFDGTWSKLQDQPPATTTVAPLPLLQELVWDCHYDAVTPREFLGAQPTVLHAPYALISQCWLGGAADAPAEFLARVCDLRITTLFEVSLLEPTDVARVLRAAPQLKTFYIDDYVSDNGSWLTPTAPTHPAFEGLVHPRLREFGFARDEEDGEEATPAHDGWVAHLRRCHFPRLRKVVGDDAYFVTSPDFVSVEAGTTA
jgi:hypothetical protein